VQYLVYFDDVSCALEEKKNDIFKHVEQDFEAKEALLSSNMKQKRRCLRLLLLPPRRIQPHPCILRRDGKVLFERIDEIRRRFRRRVDGSEHLNASFRTV